MIESRVSPAGIAMLERIGAKTYLDANFEGFASIILEAQPQTVGQVYEECKSFVTMLSEEDKLNDIRTAAEVDGDVFFGPTLFIMSEYLGDRILNEYLTTEE